MRRILLLIFGLMVLIAGNVVNGQVITTIAGNGTAGYISDGVGAFSTEINYPFGVVADTTGNIYFSDLGNHRIRKINRCGIISAIAGTGVAGNSGNGGAAILAQVNAPTGITMDMSGNIYFCDSGCRQIRKINTSGVISLVAGTGGSGNGSDGITATATTFDVPMGIVVDGFNNIYFSDKSNNRVRKISSTGTITNFAGNSNGNAGIPANGGQATADSLNQPIGLAIDRSGNIYIADQGNNEIRIISSTGIISAFAGIHTPGSAGDGAAATLASLKNPTGVYADTSNNVYIVDQGNNKIRVVSSGTINTYAGAGTAGFSGDHGMATAAKMNMPYLIAGSNNGNVYFTDVNNNRIRKIFTAYGPAFVNGNSQTLTMCSNSGVHSINTLLVVADTIGGQSLTWSVKTNARHGVLVASYSAIASGCSAITPTGLSYTPATGFSGTDTFKIKVSDGLLSDSTIVIVTVNPLPATGSITGPYSLCLSSTGTFIESVTGGAWNLSNGNAIIASTLTDTLVINSLTNGLDTITYSLTSLAGCTARATKVIVVNPYVSPIMGAASGSLCTGTTATLTDSVATGSWLSSNTSVATIATNGILTGVDTGTTTITYTVIACGSTVFTTKNITVNLTPSAGTITGSTNVCLSSTTTLTDTVTGGTWNASNGNATVSGGVITGVSAGYDTISYTVTTSFCTSIATASVIVAPYAGRITGLSYACTSATSTYTETVAGGTWSSNDTAVATIDSFSGILTVHSTGTTILSYTIIFPSCSDTIFTTKTINVYNPPAVPDSIIGNDTVCQAASITLSDTTSAGVWTLSPIAYASVTRITGTNSALLHGNAGGMVAITYTVFGSSGCSAAQTKSLYVKPFPTVASISGGANTCAGTYPDTLADVTPGGTWLSSNNSIATVTPTVGDSGVVQGVIAGNVIISYSLTNVCGTTTVTKSISVNPLPNSGIITGSSTVCQGATDTLTNAVSSGYWFSKNHDAYVVAPSVIQGITPGLDTIGFIVSTIYCGSDTAYFNITVKPLPLRGTITGPTNVCTGRPATLQNNTFTGTGIWKSINIDTATVSSVVDTFGVVHGILAGSDTIWFVTSNSCGSDSVSKVLTVRQSPHAGTIFGDSIVCMSATDTLRDTLVNLPGGIWAVKNSHVHLTTVDSVTSVALANSSGKDTITFRINTTYCGSDTAFAYVNVKPLPNPGTISGSSTVCNTKSITLYDTTYSGGIHRWYSVNPGIANINSLTGVVSGNLPGQDTILFVVASSNCGSDTLKKAITVNPQPFVGVISGPDSLCVGTTITLTDITPGNAWSASNNHSTVDSMTGTNTNGIVTGKSAGLDTIIYKCINSCGVDSVKFNIKVKPKADAGVITGLPVICQKDTSTYMDSIIGGRWFSFNNFVIVNNSGFVKAVSPGIDTIIYTKTNYCNTDTATIIITVSPLPNAGVITGASQLCNGAKITLSDSISGGSWFQVNLNSIVNNSGVVIGKTPGTDTIRYVITNSCGSATAVKTIVINPLPDVPTISTHTAAKVCLNTMYQNFGADTMQGNGKLFTWSVTNGELYATGRDKQYCLVNFIDTGVVTIGLVVTVSSTGCADSTNFKVNVKGTGTSPAASVIYSAPEFFSLDSAATYQWGYDDVITKDSMSLPGEINQNYYNPAPDFGHNYYWVVTSYGTCYQKAYFNTPTGTQIVTTLDDIKMELFPNPATNEFTIYVNGVNALIDYKVKLLDIAGKEIKIQNLKNGKGIMDISDVASGLYLVVLERNGFKVITNKIIKN